MKSQGTAYLVTALALVASMGIVRGQSAPAQGAAPAEPKKAEEAFKNIQVLKGIPADQLIPTMQFISTSLGVRCEHCHVERQFDKDDKQPKLTARKMIQMEFAINQANFNGRTEVTCYSCHRGGAEPVGIPLVAEEGSQPPREEGPRESMGAPAPMPAVPPANQILDKYIQALGGAEAIQKVTSRVEEGTVTAFGRQLPIEVFSKAPNMRLSVMHFPNGDSVTAYDGHTGWLSGMRQPPHPMNSEELVAARLDGEFYFATEIPKLFRQVRPARPEKVGDAEMYVLLGITPGRPPVKLYFDEQSGLLRREVRYMQTVLGRLPTQIDFDDYRDVDDVKVPYRWTMARPEGRFTIQVDQVQQNVPIDDGKFAMPTVATAPAPKPPVQ